MSALPTGTVTFLFTDIEGSTTRWEQHPAAMKAALAQHDALMRAAFAAHGGTVFQTAGDSFVAVFARPGDALAAAFASQRALRDALWSEPIGMLKVRAALHTGQAEARADGLHAEYTLNRTARLLTAGYGGQILLSDVTRELLREDLPAEASVRDLGAVRLKDLLSPLHVYQLLAPDLPADFPPLKSLDAPPGIGDRGSGIGDEGPGTNTHHASRTTQDGAPPNPYKGLRAFQEADAADFFGREALTARLVARLAEPVPLARFLVVVGPSGSGKSSVVRAGLVPALRGGVLPGSAVWPVLHVIPGAHPLEELDAALLSVAANAPASLMELLQSDERGLIRAVKRVLPRDETTELVLVIDQFEEVFTLVGDEGERGHFLASLYAAAADLRSRVRIVATLRADFYDRPLLYPDPGELVRQRTEVVLPLNPAELHQAVTRPAERVGVACAAELVTAISQEVGEQPGTLPLLQYALTELFERRTGRTLTLAAYRETGGVLGALARRAEETYAGLTSAEQALARQVFLRLVTLGEGVEDTRRRVRLAELSSLAPAATTLEAVLEVFGRYRLLTFDRDPATGGPTVEVAHEALLRSWERLREWLDASREDLRVQRRLGAEAADWARAGRDAGLLAAGTRLAQFEGLATAGDVALTAEEQSYLAASVAERERQATVERERQAHELALAREMAAGAEREAVAARQAVAAQRSAAKRLRGLVVGLALFLIVAAALAIFAFSQQAEANAQRQQAQANFTRADAQRLAAEANTLLAQGGRPELIALLGVRSMHLQYSPQGDAALAGAATLNYPLRRFTGHSGEVEQAVFSPDGKYVVTASNDRTARLWDVQTGQEVRRFTGHTDFVFDVAYSPDGKHIATASQDMTARLWDVQTGQELQRFSGHTAPVYGIAFSPDGKYVLTGSLDHTARLWDVRTGQEVRRFAGHTDIVIKVAYSPDGKYIATASADHTARLWDAQTGSPVRAFAGHTAIVYGVAFSPDGKTLLTGSWDRTARLWDVATGSEIGRLTGHTDAIRNVAFSPDGKYALSGSDDNSARLWDAQTGAELQRFSGQSGGVLAVTFAPDSRTLLTSAGDYTAIIWDTRPHPEWPLFVGHTGPVQAVAFAPDGKSVLTGSADQTARLWDTVTGQEERRFSGHTDPVDSVAFSPDGKDVLTGGLDRTARLWDVRTGVELKRLVHPDFVPSVAFSPDGKYLLTGDGGGRVESDVRLWDAQSGAELRRFPGSPDGVVSGLAFSPDGKTIFSAGYDPLARLWDAQTGAQLRVFAGLSKLGAGAAAFAPDGHTVLAADNDGIVRQWDVASGREIQELTGGGGAFGVVFSPDGRMALGTGANNTARLWDLQSGAEVRRLTGHTGSVNAVAFSADGRTVLTGSADGTARLWDADYHDTIRYLCSRLVRDFSADERTQYGITDTTPTCPAH